MKKCNAGKPVDVGSCFQMKFRFLGDEKNNYRFPENNFHIDKP